MLQIFLRVSLLSLTLCTGVIFHSTVFARSDTDATLPVTDISFHEVRRNKENMTDLQWEEYAKSIKGKRIRWSGYVEEVKSKFFGGYQVLVDMDPPHDKMSVQDVYLDKVTKEQALSLEKDNPIEFEGTISSAISVLGSLQISLKDVKIIQ